MSDSTCAGLARPSQAADNIGARPKRAFAALTDLKPRHAHLNWQAAERLNLCSSFDKLRMRLSVFNGLNLMVSLPNHGPHRFGLSAFLFYVSFTKAFQERLKILDGSPRSHNLD